MYRSLGLINDNDFGQNNAAGEAAVQESETVLSEIIETRTVQRGDSIYTILSAAGLSPAEIDAMTSQLTGDKALQGFRPGTTYELETTRDGVFKRLSWHASPVSTLHMVRNQQTGAWIVNKENVEIDTRVATLEGTLHSSLARNLQKHGRAALAPRLNRILSSRIDFRRDIHAGTTYRILYQEKWIDKQFTSTGDILAVEINMNGRRVNAYKFTDAKGNTAYYDKKGIAVAQRRPLYIKPCNYRRISSGYGYRIHPITKRRHFHGGIDLAAPTGTPVRAVADGRITWCGRKGAAGNMVTIEHARGVKTKYLHLSRFASTCRSGKYVRQGQVIGYVGSTGRATGPHLDFRIYKNNHSKNPLIVLRQKAPTRRLSQAELRGFMAKIQTYHNQLEGKPVSNSTTSCSEHKRLLQTQKPLI